MQPRFVHPDVAAPLKRLAVGGDDLIDAGEEHTDQELRNAVYARPWTADAKRYFSKTGCAAYGMASDYLRGSPIRQEYLETAIDWRSEGEIEDYMSKHQHDKNATPLWQYFQKVINWVKATFPKYRREMKGVNWGVLYNQFKDEEFDTDKLEQQVAKLMMDDDVERKSGIYPYVLDGDERHLNIRAFSDNMKREAYERQKGVCVKCKKKFQLDEMEGDHIRPWHEGGKTNAANQGTNCPVHRSLLKTEKQPGGVTFGPARRAQRLPSTTSAQRESSASILMPARTAFVTLGSVSCYKSMESTR